LKFAGFWPDVELVNTSRGNKKEKIHNNVQKGLD